LIITRSNAREIEEGRSRTKEEKEEEGGEKRMHWKRNRLVDLVDWRAGELADKKRLVD